MRDQAVLAAITAAAGNLPDLSPRLAVDFRGQFQARADGRGVGYPSETPDGKPAIGIAVVNVEKVILPIQIGNKQIEKTVVIEIGPGTAVAGRVVIDQ